MTLRLASIPQLSQKTARSVTVLLHACGLLCFLSETIWRSLVDDGRTSISASFATFRACAKATLRLPGVTKTGALKTQVPSVSLTGARRLVHSKNKCKADLTDQTSPQGTEAHGNQDKWYATLSMRYSIPSYRGRGNTETGMVMPASSRCFRAVHSVPCVRLTNHEFISCW